MILTRDNYYTPEADWEYMSCSQYQGWCECEAKQLAKLVDVRDIKVLEPEDSVSRELVLVKVSAKPEQRQGIISIADIFRAKVIDVSKDSMIIEMTGTKSKLEAFIDLLDDYEILELARTGITGLSRGTHNIRYL